MRKKNGILYAFLPLIITFSIFIIFYETIESKPTDAGFWFILVLGMSLGVALTRTILWFKTK